MMSRNSRRLAMVALAAAIIACNKSPTVPSPGDTPQVQTNTITITASGASPRNIQVALGTRVLIINNDSRSPATWWSRGRAAFTITTIPVKPTCRDRSSFAEKQFACGRRRPGDEGRHRLQRRVLREILRLPAFDNGHRVIGMDHGPDAAAESRAETARGKRAGVVRERGKSIRLLDLVTEKRVGVTLRGVGQRAQLRHVCPGDRGECIWNARVFRDEMREAGGEIPG